MSNDTTKTCTKCNITYPATLEYFHAQKARKDGLHCWCKACVRQHHENNRDKIAERRRKYKQANREKIAEKTHEYYQVNREKIAKYHREHYQANKTRIDERNRKYYQINQEERNEYTRKYQKENPDKRRLRVSRYRARKRQLPDTFTETQWIVCLEYFGYACAVCGIEFGDSTPHADHWIPITSDECTGTIVTNMVCLCRACNQSKSDTMPDVWIKREYDVDKANEILERIDIYFKLMSDSDESCEV